MGEPIEGIIFIGCTECGEEYDEEWERHKPTCSRVDEIMELQDED